MAAMLIVATILLQMVLTLIIYWVLGVRRFDALNNGDVKTTEINIDKSKYPEKAKLAEFAVSNQFELPVLFYAGAGISLYLGAWWLDAALACLFVASRYGHAFVHLTSNRLTLRFNLFTAGYFIIMAWVGVLTIRFIGMVVS